MDDSSILDLDDVMGMEDSFCVSDDDVLKILHTWKITGSEPKASEFTATTQKFFDSRTFTRPPKKRLQYPPECDSIGAAINPQIGGAVSSAGPFGMQRSLINDVSPPSSLASSSVSYDCGNSLITSGDFTNMSGFLDGNSDMPSNHFMRMNSFRRSKFAHRLADFDEAKDNSIAKTDMHGIVVDGMSSGNSTLQNSMEGDTTFVKNKTFDKNATFDAGKDDDAVPLNRTFEKISELTTVLDVTPIQDSTISNDFEIPVLRRKTMIQSTPLCAVNIQVEDLSPITLNPPVLRRSRNPDDDKRISLQNFEDVEKSISLLENSNGGIEEFEAILEEMTDLRKPLEREKELQNLQNIKNRHSLNLDRSLTLEKDKKTFDNSLIESLTSSSERLLRRSRVDEDLVVEEKPAAPQPPQAPVVTGQGERKNRDRFKTMRITKKHIEGMIVIDDLVAKEAAELEIPDEVDSDEADQQSSHVTANNETFKKPIVPFKTRTLSQPRFYSGSSGLPQKKDLRLQLGTAKASSFDHLDSNRIESTEDLTQAVMNSKQQLPRGSLGGQLAPVKSNLKSPMGIKSKSYHNLTFSSSQPQMVTGGSAQTTISRPVSRLTRPSGLSVAGPQSLGSNTNLNTTITTSKPAVTKKPVGLVRPSSGYYNYSTNNGGRARGVQDYSDTESGRYSPNSLSSSSASSRGSLYPSETMKIQSSVEDISAVSASSENNSTIRQPTATPVSRIARPSGLKPPSSTRPVRSALPRFGFVKR